MEQPDDENFSGVTIEVSAEGQLQMNRYPLGLKIFIGALLLRWMVVLLLLSSMGIDGVLGVDSRGYLRWMTEFAAEVRAGTVTGWNWLGPEVSLMPLPSWLWISSALLLGEHSAIGAVLLQGVLDSGTCVLISAIAGRFDARYAVPAGIAAIANPTQIVMSSLYYTDTMFLFFVTLALYGSVRWLIEAEWPAAWLLGLGLGGAALSRVFVVPWATFLLLCLIGLVGLGRRFGRGQASQLAVASLALLVCTTPIVLRNGMQLGTWTLTTQTGSYSAFWIVPLVMQAKNGTPWEEGVKMVRQRIEHRYGPDSGDRSVDSHRQSQVASEALRELGVVALSKAWLYGAAINLGAPAATIFPPVAQLPRTGFFATPGPSTPAKIVNFLFHSDNRLYAWIILTGVGGVVTFRLTQVWGMFAVLRQRKMLSASMVLGSWVAFILLVNGPIASPKYRLPIEPVLVLLTAAGYCALREKFCPRR